MKKSTLHDLPELVEAGLISEETADQIRQYHAVQPDKSGQRVLIIFGILGAVLVGLGLILIVAHNWDHLSRPVKLFFAFLPLVAGQVAAGLVVWKKNQDKAWRESSAAFLFLAIGGCISMISQIYNIPGEVSGLLLIWMVLGAPLIYLLRSSVASFIFLSGITYYAVLVGYSEYPTRIPYAYWGLLALVLPHYYFLNKHHPESNFTIFHHWMLPLSLIITLGSFGQQEELLMFLAYFSLFGWLYLIGRLTYFEEQNLRNNGFLILGSLGMVGMLLLLSFDFTWEELYRQRSEIGEWLSTPEFWVSQLLTLVAVIFLYYVGKRKNFNALGLSDVLFLIFLLVFIIGIYAPLQALTMVNILLFLLGIFYIRRGIRMDHLGILNYGLLIITALIVCRFFDTKIPFILRGVLFIMVGIGFFIANFRMFQKRKTTD